MGKTISHRSHLLSHYDPPRRHCGFGGAEDEIMSAFQLTGSWASFSQWKNGPGSLEVFDVLHLGLKGISGGRKIVPPDDVLLPLAGYLTYPNSNQPRLRVPGLLYVSPSQTTIVPFCHHVPHIRTPTMLSSWLGWGNNTSSIKLCSVDPGTPTRLTSSTFTSCSHIWIFHFPSLCLTIDPKRTLSLSLCSLSPTCYSYTILHSTFLYCIAHSFLVSYSHNAH
jgi:hypothetical protein